MEGKNFMGLASPGSTARSAEPDPTSIGDVLSVSQLSTEKSFYKVKDVPKAEDRKLDDGEDVADMPMQRQPSVPMGPSVMPMGRKGEANEAELLVKRVCEGLDGTARARAVAEGRWWKWPKWRWQADSLIPGR
eukprot:g15277.t1